MANVQNTIIIGKIPGYGSTLDDQNTFGKILLRDITYIDMIPASYSINKGMLGLGENTNWREFYIYNSGSDASSSVKIFKDVLKTMGKYLKNKTKKNMEQYSKFFPDNNLGELANSIIDNWVNSASIRILGANDSTFTETIANNFSDNNSASSLPGLGNTALTKILPDGSSLLNGESVIGKIQNMSYDTALDALTTGSSGGLAALLTGKILGVQFAMPNTWQSSSYNSTLNLFIKLASPSGDPLSVLKYITLPILTLMGAGSPITVNGVTYAMPLIWDVRAYGITHFKIGAIAAMTISRGSYETVFNSMKQPLLVDVRITIVPLMQDFAVQYSGESTSKAAKSIKTNISNTINDIIGSKDAKTAASVVKDGVSSAASAAKNALPDAISKAFSSMENLFREISNNATSTIAGHFDKSGLIYGTSGLGVQSPGDEIDGLSGLPYEGVVGNIRDTVTKVGLYDNESYIKGFANSYTFKL